MRETRLLIKHEKGANYHVMCPDIVVESKNALRIRDKQPTALNEEYTEVDWGDIVDKRVLAANRPRLLRCHAHAY